jgi:hypothetical protein
VGAGLVAGAAGYYGCSNYNCNYSYPSYSTSGGYYPYSGYRYRTY